ncbi:hypothetical protein Dimus_020539 [Dionaea muscipula]
MNSGRWSSMVAGHPWRLGDEYSTHPMTPIVSVHHLDARKLIFPNISRMHALDHLSKSIKLDSASIMQQSIYNDNNKHWSIRV